MSNTERIQIFLDKFPLFLPTVNELDKNSIPWMISGSGCLFLLGNDRVPDDVDIFLPNDKHDEADRLFSITSYYYTSETEKVRNSNPEGDHSIQLTSDLVLTIESKTYNLQVTPQVIANRKEVHSEEQTLWLLPPEEVLLVKALLRRGAEVGKHDLEDIKTFSELYAIDSLYLQKRIHELGATERIGNTFDSLQSIN